MAHTEPDQSTRPRKPRWLKPAIRIGGAMVATGCIVALLLMLAGVFHQKVKDVAAEPLAQVASDLPQAKVHFIKRPRFETAIGTIKPVHESAVASKLLARVAEIRVKAGQAVAKDELLVKLDDSDLKARLEQAEAVEVTANARKQQADADYARVQKLFNNKVATQSDFDQALAAMKTANSEVERARQAVKEAKVILEYATLRSPLTGTVVDKRVEAGDTVTPGQVLVTLYDPTHMQMVASVRESLALQLTVGQELPARLESLGYECEATVSEIVPEAQAASRSFTVKVTGPCPPGVYSGMFGRLLLPLEQEEVLVMPSRAVRRVGQLTLVDVVSDGQVQRRAVQLGRMIEGDVEVLSGLRAGERVLVLADDAAKGRS